MTPTSLVTRIFVMLSIAALVLISMSRAVHTHAAPVSSRSATYVAPDGSYQFAYPATWSKQYPQGLDILVVAPDRNAVVTTLSFADTSSNLKELMGVYVKDLRATLNTAHYHRYRLSDGNSLFLASALVRCQDGHEGIAVMAFERVRTRIYMITGLVPNIVAPAWKQDEAQLAQTVTSFSVDPSSFSVDPSSSNVAPGSSN
jgi:hypothetical protein